MIKDANGRFDGYSISPKIRKILLHLCYELVKSDSLWFFFSYEKVKVNKKDFHAFKQPIALNLLSVNQILISNKFEYSGKGFKYFIGYKDDNNIRPLCIILPQMSWILKY